MKKRIGVFIGVVLVLAIAMAIPILSSASSSTLPTAVATGMGTCTPTGQPYPQPPLGAIAATNPADGGKVWVSSGSQQAGTSGPHGYLVAGTGGVSGYSHDSSLNGKVSTAGACLSFNNTKVTAP